MGTEENEILNSVDGLSRTNTDQHDEEIDRLGPFMVSVDRGWSDSVEKEARNIHLKAKQGKNLKGVHKAFLAEHYFKHIEIDRLQSIKLYGVTEEELKKIPGVTKVEPIRKYYKAKQYNWAIDRIDQENAVPEFTDDKNYNYEPAFYGCDVDIYVVDTGMDIYHVELAEGNRKVENIYTFEKKDLNEDFDGHGTTVAAMAGGRFVGSAPCSNLYGLKVFDLNGNTYTDVILAALEVITRRHQQKGFNAKTVVNLSLGGPCGKKLKSCVGDTLVEKITELSNLGMVFAIASGNDGLDATFSSPAACEEAVVVAASNITDDFSYYSNWGPFVDITAPGTWVVAPCSSSSLSYQGVCANGQAYVYTSGTSLAAPIVAGVLAQYIEKASLPGQDGTGLSMTNLAAVNLVRDSMVCDALVGRLGKVPAETVNNIVQLPVDDGFMGCGSSRVELTVGPSPSPSFAPSGPTLAPTTWDYAQTTNSENNSSDNWGVSVMYIGVVFLVVGIVSVITVIYCWLSKRSSNSQTQERNDQPTPTAVAIW